MAIYDLPAVYSLGESVFTKDKHVFLYRTWETYEVTGLFSTDPELCIVAESERAVVGFALGSIIEKPRSPWTYGYLVWTGIAKDYQRYGVGGQLYRDLERRVKRLGARMMIIDTEGTNLPAIRFFEKMGFARGSQHLWMTKVLSKRARSHRASATPNASLAKDGAR